MTAVTRGLGPDSLKTRCSNEGGAGMVMTLVINCGYSTTTPMMAWLVHV